MYYGLVCFVEPFGLLGEVMFGNIQLIGGRQFIFTVRAFISVGEELDLPSSDFTEGSFCRVDEVLGQSFGMTRYKATILRGRALSRQRRMSQHNEDERVSRKGSASEKFYRGEASDGIGGENHHAAFYEEPLPDVVESDNSISEGLQHSSEHEENVLGQKEVVHPLVSDNSFDDSSGKEVFAGGRRSRWRVHEVEGTSPAIEESPVNVSNEDESQEMSDDQVKALAEKYGITISDDEG